MAAAFVEQDECQGSASGRCLGNRFSPVAGRLARPLKFIQWSVRSGQKVNAGMQLFKDCKSIHQL